MEETKKPNITKLLIGIGTTEDKKLAVVINEDTINYQRAIITVLADTIKVVNSMQRKTIQPKGGIVKFMRGLKH